METPDVVCGLEHLRNNWFLFHTNAKSVLLCHSETWRTTQATLHKLQSFINGCLRKLLCIRWPKKIRNEDLWKTANQEPVAAQIRRRKWGWVGHTLRKPASSISRQALTWNLQGKRKRGRPRNTWRRDTKAETLRSGHSWKELEKAQSWVLWRIVVDGLCSSVYVIIFQTLACKSFHLCLKV